MIHILYKQIVFFSLNDPMDILCEENNLHGAKPAEMRSQSNIHLSTVETTYNQK